jgi:hypothetical protein
MGTTMRGVLLVATLAVAASGCGTSSSTSVNAPSSRCTVSATAQPAAVGAPGGSGSIIITTDRECAWEARSEADWLSVADATGRGDGSLRYTASGNPIVSERRGAVVVNGLRVEIGQAAAACAFALDRSEQAVGAAGGRHDVAVSAQAGCAWTARSDVPWITIAAGAAGQGAGVVSVSVAPNAGLEARSAVVTIAGRPHLVEQAAGVLVPTPTPGPTPPTDPNCGLTVSPLVSAMSADGGSLEVVVTASASTCTWTAASAVPWIVMEGGVGEVGSGRRRFIVAPNPTTLGRTGTLVIAGSIVTVTQAPAEPPPTPTPTPTPPTPTPCSYAVTPNPVSVGFGGSGDIDLHIVTTAGCAWTATSQAPWIAISSAPSGTGDSHLHISVTPTLLINGRTGTLVVAEQTVTVNQAGILNQEVTITDRIVGLTGSCPTRSFTLSGVTVVTTARTEYPGKEDCGDLREGRKARVQGTGQPDGTILANRIDHIESALPGQEDE